MNQLKNVTKAWFFFVLDEEGGKFGEVFENEGLNVG